MIIVEVKKDARRRNARDAVWRIVATFTTREAALTCKRLYEQQGYQVRGVQ